MIAQRMPNKYKIAFHCRVLDDGEFPKHHHAAEIAACQRFPKQVSLGKWMVGLFEIGTLMGHLWC